LAELALSDESRSTLATIARRAVVAAASGCSYAPPREWIVGPLAAPGASFVTLRTAGELRGCIGSIRARRALGVDVAENGRAAALRDPRFAPVGAHELARLAIELTLLRPPEPLAAGSRAELLAALVPGVDGLVLEEHGRGATFLPAVWEQLPDPEAFLFQLERKAGLGPGSWSPARRLFRYRAESFVVGAALAASDPADGSE
jgi:AmmeMemoRadiSam system protein A